jgi:methoxymalonate biosynthesis acyl carrier protein
MTNNDSSQVKEIVRRFINDSINIDGLGDDENLFESGLINSLFAIQLTTFVERRFGIEVGMNDLSIDNFKSINATAAFVTRKSEGREAYVEPGTSGGQNP